MKDGQRVQDVDTQLLGTVQIRGQEAVVVWDPPYPGTVDLSEAVHHGLYRADNE
jgi:hypothetical protein